MPSLKTTPISKARGSTCKQNTRANRLLCGLRPSHTSDLRLLPLKTVLTPLTRTAVSSQGARPQPPLPLAQGKRWGGGCLMAKQWRDQTQGPPVPTQRLGSHSSPKETGTTLLSPPLPPRPTKGQLPRCGQQRGFPGQAGPHRETPMEWERKGQQNYRKEKQWLWP